MDVLPDQDGLSDVQARENSLLPVRGEMACLNTVFFVWKPICFFSR